MLMLMLMLLALMLSVAADKNAVQAVQAVALYDYDATETDELSLRRGELLTIVGSVAGEDEWVQAKLASGTSGLIPLNYVELRAPDEPDATAGSTANSLAAAAAAAVADADSVSGDPAVADAMRRYRNRRAFYNSGQSAEQLHGRWGVRLDLEPSSAGGSQRSDAEPLAAATVTAKGIVEPEPDEHRSGVDGVPFFNLIGYMDDGDLSRAVVQLMRDEWLSVETRNAQGLLSGLGAALSAAAGPGSRDVILTFANSGYADFVLNGFGADVAPSTLVIALDAAAHERFVAAGLHSFYDDRMPTMAPAQAYHASAAFMDIMKLRLLYMAEVLLLGYNALLTDADAVVHAPPFTVFPSETDLVVACDSTVVPANWRESPGMVMAGFFYARAGPRPIILLKEVLDYQVHHPEQHDQQSFNQILSELLAADISVSVMHPRLFPNGFQYFAKRTVQREGGLPLVVQNNWIMGAENKRHRFREAGLWDQDEPEYYQGSPDAPLRLLRFDPRQPRVTGLRRETSALIAALRIAVLLDRVLLLPETCAFTNTSGLVPPPPLTYRDREGRYDANVLDDDVDADWCTTEWFFDMAAMREGLPGRYREAAFLSHPSAKAAFEPRESTPAAATKPPRFFIEASEGWREVPPHADAVVLTPSSPEAGASDDEIRAWFAPHAQVPILELGDLAGRVQMPTDGGGGTEGEGGTDSGAGAPTSRGLVDGDGGDASGLRGAALSSRLLRSVVYREEIERHVRQQVQAASPFDCLCVQGGGVDLLANLSSIISDFRARVPSSRAVFVAGYRLDLDGLVAPFQGFWDHAYALALYDWNGSGLQGQQFSSVINRLICQHAERVHFPTGLEARQECE